MNCRFCGKAVATRDARCPHCGETVVSADFRSLQDVITSDAATGEVQRLLRHTPSARGAGARLVVMITFGLGMVGLTVFFFIVTTKRRDAAPIFQVLMSIVGLGGLAMVVGGVRGLVKLTRSPLSRVPAIVLAKGQKMSGGRYSHEVCLLTIQTEDGRKKRYPVSHVLFAEVEEGDAGIAYFRGGYLLDFNRLQLPTEKPPEGQ